MVVGSSEKMSSKVTVKFKSGRDMNQVNFAGSHITLAELTKKLVEIKRLSKAQADFELIVSNIQTKLVYKGDDTKIPKNTRLLVQRVPASNGVLYRMKHPTKKGDPGSATRKVEAEKEEFGGDVFTVTHKLAEVAQQRSQLAKQRNRQAGGRGMPIDRGPGGQRNVSMNTSNLSIQRQQDQARRVNIGIPKNYLGVGEATEAGEAGGEGDEDPQNKTPGVGGAGGWMRFKSDTESFQQRVKARGGATTRLSDDEVRKRVDVKDVPNEFLCALTNRLIKEAVNLPCCSKACSSEDVQNELVNNGFVCPLCQTSGIILDKLEPNNQLRRSVEKFIVEQRDKIESNAQLETERARAEADKERERKLLDNKSYNRPDAILDLSAKPPPDDDNTINTTNDDDKQQVEEEASNSNQENGSTGGGDGDGDRGEKRTRSPARPYAQESGGFLAYGYDRRPYGPGGEGGRWRRSPSPRGGRDRWDDRRDRDYRGGGWDRSRGYRRSRSPPPMRRRSRSPPRRRRSRSPMRHGPPMRRGSSGSLRDRSPPRGRRRSRSPMRGGFRGRSRSPPRRRPDYHSGRGRGNSGRPQRRSRSPRRGGANPPPRRELSRSPQRKRSRSPSKDDNNPPAAKRTRSPSPQPEGPVRSQSPKRSRSPSGNRDSPLPRSKPVAERLGSRSPPPRRRDGNVADRLGSPTRKGEEVKTSSGKVLILGEKDRDRDRDSRDRGGNDHGRSKRFNEGRRYNDGRKRRGGRGRGRGRRR